MDTQGFNWIQLFQYLVPSGLASSIPIYLWAKYIRIRPKIVLNFRSGFSSQRTEGTDKYVFTWHPVLTFHNDSTYVARRIKIVASSGIQGWRCKEQPPERLEADSKVERDFEIQKTESREVVVQLCGPEALAQGRLAEAYLPHVLGDATIILSYDNEKDTTFYTTFTLINGTSGCKLSWRRPKLKSRANGS